MEISEGGIMDYKIMKKSALNIAGLTKKMSMKNDEHLLATPEFWGEFSMSEKALPMIENMSKLGFVCAYTNRKQQEFDYTIGVEVYNDIDDDLNFIDIPSIEWAVFEVSGDLPQAMQKMWQQIYSEYMPSISYKHGNIPELEVYPDGDTTAEDYHVKYGYLSYDL